MIFVFGSNEKGIHGAGAARVARTQHGAIYGVGFGLHNNSFAIPTKDISIQTLDLMTIADYVAMFMTFAQRNRQLEFQVTRIGCGLAGLKDGDIAPMFNGAPENCLFDTKWHNLLGDQYNYWGTY